MDVAVVVGVVVVVGELVIDVVGVLVADIVAVEVTVLVAEELGVVDGVDVTDVVGDEVGVVISHPGNPPTRNSSVIMFSVSTMSQSPVGSMKNLFSPHTKFSVLSPAGPRYSINALLIAVAVAPQLASPLVSASAMYVTP